MIVYRPPIRKNTRCPWYICTKFPPTIITLLQHSLCLHYKEDILFEAFTVGSTNQFYKVVLSSPPCVPPVLPRCPWYICMKFPPTIITLLQHSLCLHYKEDIMFEAFTVGSSNQFYKVVLSSPPCVPPVLPLAQKKQFSALLHCWTD